MILVKFNNCENEGFRIMTQGQLDLFLASARVYADMYAAEDTFWFKKHYVSKPKVSIFSTWIKSIHNKTCPLIEFKEDNK